MTIGLGHGGTTMYTAGTASRQLLIGTIQGIVRLRQDDRGDWHETGRALEGQHIHALVVELRSGPWFAGAYRTGVFVSADDGLSWAPRLTGLTEPSVFSIAAVECSDGRVRLYAGTEPAHLFYSDDLVNTVPSYQDSSRRPRAPRGVSPPTPSRPI